MSGGAFCVASKLVRFFISWKITLKFFWNPADIHTGGFVAPQKEIENPGGFQMKRELKRWVALGLVITLLLPNFAFAGYVEDEVWQELQEYEEIPCLGVILKQP